jgi:hypothetical protein
MIKVGQFRVSKSPGCQVVRAASKTSVYETSSSVSIRPHRIVGNLFSIGVSKSMSQNLRPASGFETITNSWLKNSCRLSFRGAASGEESRICLILQKADPRCAQDDILGKVFNKLLCVQNSGKSAAAPLRAGGPQPGFNPLFSFSVALRAPPLIRFRMAWRISSRHH